MVNFVRSSGSLEQAAESVIIRFIDLSFIALNSARERTEITIL